MNALLVYPRYPDTFWSFKHIMKVISKKAAFPPLGLLTIGAMLPSEWNKKLVDVNVTDISDEHIKWADMVFISAMLVQSKSAGEIIKRCKAKGKTVVAGGPLFTTDYKKFPGVDHFVLNEAEVTLPLFLEDFRNDKLKRIYSSSIRPDIKKTPIPLWSLINIQDYVTMALQYSRGCPFNCEFCDIIIMNGRVPRTKTPKQMIRELQSLYDAGWKGTLFIVDDNFIGNKVKVKEMLAAVIKWQKEHRYPFKIMTEASVNLASDEELMNLMSAANFNKVFLGIESPDTNSLKECGKVQNINMDPSLAVKAIHKHGMQVMGGFIVGFDGDTETIFEKQTKFIQSMGVVTAMVGLLNVLPQTRLWHRLKAEGRLVEDSTGENTDGTINFLPKMGKDKLIKGYKSIIAKIYSPKNYYKRINTFLKGYKPTVKGGFQKEEISAFIKSLWNIGILSKTRVLYWKLLIKTSIFKTKALPAAVECAICLPHFEKVAKKVVNSG
jgi:radical SAM superfamily enzyme YgiQ (UPF0313 family)